MLTYSNLSQRFFRFSPRLFGLISKHFPPLSQGSFEPLLEDSESLLEAFLPQFEDLPAYFPRLSKAYFQELPNRFPKRFCLSLKTFPPFSKTFSSFLSRTSEPLPEVFLPQSEDLSAYFQDFRKPIFMNFRVASRSLTASFLSSFEPLSKGFSKFLPKSCSLFSSLFCHFPKAS